jgi:hypothetical protein
MKNKKLLIFVSGVITIFCIEIYLAYKINKLLENYPTITIHDTIYREYSDWELLKIAIIWQESKGNSKAIGGNGKGIYQIAPIYVKECNRILGYDKYKHSDVFKDSLANDMFEVVQSYHNKEKCPKKAIKLHNKGDKYYNEVMDKYNMLKYLNDK